MRDPQICCAKLGSKVCTRKSEDGANPHFAQRFREDSLGEGGEVGVEFHPFLKLSQTAVVGVE